MPEFLLFVLYHFSDFFSGWAHLYSAYSAKADHKYLRNISYFLHTHWGFWKPVSIRSLAFGRGKKSLLQQTVCCCD